MGPNYSILYYGEELGMKGAGKDENKIYECDLHASLGKKGYEIFGHLKKFGALSRDTLFCRKRIVGKGC